MAAQQKVIRPVCVKEVAIISGVSSDGQQLTKKLQTFSLTNFVVEPIV